MMNVISYRLIFNISRVLLLSDNRTYFRNAHAHSLLLIPFSLIPSSFPKYPTHKEQVEGPEPTEQ